METRLRSLEDVSEPVEPVHIVFLIQLPKIAGGCQKFVGFQGGKWRTVHIDELSESSEQLPRIDQLVNRSIGELFKPVNSAMSEEDDGMEVDRDEMEEIGENSESDECAAFDPALILRNCLQAAAARVFDDSAKVNRATRRIDILLSLLPEDSSYETGQYHYALHFRFNYLFTNISPADAKYLYKSYLNWVKDMYKKYIYIYIYIYI